MLAIGRWLNSVIFYEVTVDIMFVVGKCVNSLFAVGKWLLTVCWLEWSNLLLFYSFSSNGSYKFTGLTRFYMSITVLSIQYYRIQRSCWKFNERSVYELLIHRSNIVLTGEYWSIGITTLTTITMWVGDLKMAAAFQGHWGDI